MESNKDEALRCVGLAKLAISLGDKQKALKFVKIAQRLNPDNPLDDLIAACGELNSAKSVSNDVPVVNRASRDSEAAETPNCHQNYGEENVRSIREIRKQKDYYAILGVEKNCSVDEIRKAYRKLSLKVHPDKNKAPGSEEAFKTVSKAFKCLSDEGSRRNYDQMGFIDESDVVHKNDVTRRRRRTTSDFYDDDFDPNEIFRSFFYGTQNAQNDIFRNQRVYRTRAMPRQRGNNNVGEEGGFGIGYLIHFVPILLFFLLAYLPLSEPEYTLQKTHAYHIPMVTEKHGVEYYVKSSEEFEQTYPQGSPSRANKEYVIVRDHKNMLSRYCHVEMQRRQWARNYPTPHCDKLRNFGVH